MMQTTDFTSKTGAVYQIGKLDAKSQFHVFRRLSTIFSSLAEIFGKNKNKLDDKKFYESLPALATAIGEMSEENADYCMAKLLSVVKKITNNNQAVSIVHVFEENGKLNFKLNFENDIDWTEMLTLCWQVLKFNMSNFFSEKEQNLKDQSENQTAQ